MPEPDTGTPSVPPSPSSLAGRSPGPTAPGAAPRPAGSLADRVRAAVRDVPDFPRPGILFKDLTPVFGDAALFAAVVDAMAAPWSEAGITHVAAAESRGFILGAPVSQRLGAAFVPLRKPGKLPAATVRVEYALEYGYDALEMHADACGGGRVLVLDDVLATGGTAAAACALVEAGGGAVAGCAFLLELGFLHGARLLADRRIERAVRY